MISCSCRNLRVTCIHEKPQLKITCNYNINIDIQLILRSGKAVKGTVVIQALPYLHGGSFEILLTVPLI